MALYPEMQGEDVLERPEERAQEIDLKCWSCGTAEGPCPVHQSAVSVIRHAMNDAREAVLDELERGFPEHKDLQAVISKLRQKTI